MDELFTIRYEDLNAVELSSLANPELNKINAKFGKDVEEVAKIGPPRPPKIPAEMQGDEVAMKFAEMKV